MIPLNNERILDKCPLWSKVWKQKDRTKVLEMLPFLSARIVSHGRLSVEFMDEAGVPRIRDEDIKPRTRTRRPLDECPLNEDYANIPNHDAILAREEARLEEKAAADAQKAQDKADKKAAAAAQIFHVFGVVYVPGVRFFIISTYLVLDFYHKVIK